MGHSRALLDLVALDVAKSWPAADGYRMVFEAPLPGVRGMLPDIIVFDAAEAVRCVVEIGYTRPEKLTHYRESGTEDVRWYDKSGKLHGDVNVRVEVTHRQERVRPPRGLVFKQMDIVGRARCWTCIEGDLAGYCGRHFSEQAAAIEVDCQCDPRPPLSEEQEDVVWDEVTEAHDNTRLTIISNGQRWLALIWCDECDRRWVEKDDDVIAGDGNIWSAIDFEKAHHRFKYGEYQRYRAFLAEHARAVDPLNHTELTYEQVVEMAKAQFDLDVTYDDFVPWDERRAA